jgi:glycosyltransferase involved in cell wall biosynthesis
MIRRKNICIISLSNIAFDSRVSRQIDYLRRDNDITVIGYGPVPGKYKNFNNIHWREIPRSKQTVIITAGKLVSRFITIPMFPNLHPAYHMAIKNVCDVYHANNWDALPFAALAAQEHNARLVLDLHESYDSWYWGLSTPLIKFVLKKYASDVDASTTVVKQLAEQHQQFGLKPIIIRNIPELPEEPVNFQATKPEKIQLVHHGIASPTRSSDLMIRALAMANKNYELHLFFLNQQTAYVTQLMKLAEEIAPGRVFFHPPFKPQEIIPGIARYDIGFFPLPPKNYNYQIALPNKLFEFIAAGLAVLIGPSPEMKKIIIDYHCGKVAGSFQPDVIAELLNKTSPAEWDRKKQASLVASKELNADMEMQKLLDIYANF